MGAKIGLGAAFWCICVTLAAAQTPDEPVAVYTEHPRLFLRAQRIRLLKRERERASPRWQQFETLVVGGAPMPERGFAWALYFQVTGNAEFGRKAIVWALTPAADLRQQALVFDWCQDLLSEAQRRDLTARLAKGIVDTADTAIPAVRSRTLAAIALYDHVPETPPKALDAIVHQWWERRMVPSLGGGKNVVARDDAYALWELLHAVRDNTNLDLRESIPRFFKDFPIEHLLSHYPATYAAAENEYRIGVTRKAGEPDVQAAALSRAVELAMAALAVNAAESQVLQGWLMHDRFMLRGTYGAPYEFLWANPDQPGLSYYHVPLIYHNADFGKLFVRSSWDDDAEWFGKFRMVDFGDLTWNKEHDLACPNNLIGQIDLYLVSHHGQDISSLPMLVHAMHPRVAVMNNGAKKGGAVATFETLKSSPGLENLWQLHYAEDAGDHNMPKEFIANLGVGGTSATGVPDEGTVRSEEHTS